LAIEAIKAGGIMPTVLNAANEVAVEAFLNEQVRFTDIARIIEKTMAQFLPDPANSLAHILDVDANARYVATGLISQ